MHRLVRSTKGFLVAAFAGAALLGVAGTAAATPPAAPISGDDRATVHSGNKVAADCAELFAGSTSVDLAGLTVSIDESNTYIDVTAVNDVTDGVEVAGVVVKGGPAYNIYDPADLGDLAWLDLHSPLVPSGKPAQISHWFVCGVEKITTTTTGTSTTGTSTTGTSTSTSTTTTTGGDQSSSVSTPVTTTTTSAAVAPVASDDDLASTGFNGGWLVALAVALLLGGGALLIVVRTRGARR